MVRASAFEATNLASRVSGAESEAVGALGQVDLLLPSLGADPSCKHDEFRFCKGIHNGAVWVLDREDKVGNMRIEGDVFHCPVGELSEVC